MDSVGANNTITHHSGDVKGQFRMPAKNQNVNEPKQEKTDATTLDSVVALTTALSGYSGNIKPGETVKIMVGKDEVATISKEGMSNWDRMGKAARDVGRQAVSLTSDAIQNDPSFMFREAVETVKRPLSNGAPEVIQDLAITKGLYPGIRAGVLYLDIRKAWKTLKAPESTRMDKIVDVGHCLTDLGGLVGVAAPLVGLAIPGANILAAASIVGDIVSFGYHAIRYVMNKNEANKKKIAQEQAAKQESLKPQNQAVPQNNVSPTNQEVPVNQPAEVVKPPGGGVVKPEKS